MYTISASTAAAWMFQTELMLIALNNIIIMKMNVVINIGGE